MLARQFAERAADDFDFVFVCLDGAGVMAEELRQAGYPVEVLERKPGFDLGCLRRLAAVFRRHRVNLVHAHQYAPFFYAAAARFGAWGAPPIVFTEHGRDYPDYRRSKRVLANRFLLRRKDRVIGVGNCVRKALIENEGLPEQRVEVIYNGIDTASYGRDSQQRKLLRQSLGLAIDDVAIIQVARLNRLKDHATSIRAFGRLAPLCPQARLLIVGDGEERPVVESLIRELNLEQRVSLLGTRRDVGDLLAAADIFLLTSISEGIPLTLLEAMASGLPCVSTDVGGCGEVILPRETGLLAPSGDAEELARHLLTLASNPGLRAQQGAAGQRRARSEFSSDAMHKTYQRHYHDLMKS